MAESHDDRPSGVDVQLRQADTGRDEQSKQSAAERFSRHAAQRRVRDIYQSHWARRGECVDTALSPFRLPVGSAGCGVGGTDHSVSVVVSSYSQSVALGGRGRVDISLRTNSFPVTLVQVKLGSQTVGEISGTELRDILAIGFSVPRTAGSYNLTVYAKDNAGCDTVTTAQRTVLVQ